MHFIVEELQVQGQNIYGMVTGYYMKFKQFKVETEYFRWQFSNHFFSQTIKDITMKFGQWMQKLHSTRATD